jgi:FkbM family methyltransferase
MKKYYGQFDPQVDKIIHERYFPNKHNGISIECGAFDGLLENSTKFFEENYNWKTYNIEPLNHIYEKLVNNRPNSININKALSNDNTIKKIRVYDINFHGINNTNASLNHTDKHRQLLEKISNNKFLEQNIETKTYSKLISELNIDKVDLFILDVEGHEFEVLEGMIGCNVLPDVFVIEHGHREVGVFDEYLSKLNAQYKLDFVSHVNSFYVKIT